MLDKTRKDRDYLWGRIFGALSMWLARAPRLTSAQRAAYIRDWDLHPVTTLRLYMERHQAAVIAAGAARGAEDAEIGRIMAIGDSDAMADDSPLGADCHIGYYHEIADARDRAAAAELGRRGGASRSAAKAAAARANGAKGGRPPQTRGEARRIAHGALY